MPSQGTIGDRVRGLRLSRRMSQAQLAGPDLSDSYVSLIESGKRTPTPVVARLLAERLGCTTEFLLHGIEPRQRIDTELGLRHAELELYHGDPALAADRFGDIVKAAGEDNALLAAHARLGRARALEAQGKIGSAVEAYERLRREAAAHPERLADIPLIVALCRCYQRAGDTLRARDLGAGALEHISELSVVHGDVAVDLAAALAEAEIGLPYVEEVLASTGVPVPADRTTEILSLWQASVTAAEGEDSALAVRFADDALSAGRPARIAVRMARIAMRWAEISVPLRGNDPERVGDLVSRATQVFSLVPADAVDHARSLLVLAHLRLKSGDHAGAETFGRNALDVLPDGSTSVAASAHLVLAEAGLARSDSDQSLTLRRAGALLATAPRNGALRDREVARVWRELGDLWGRAGRRDEQTGAYRKALEAVGVRSTVAGAVTSAVVAR
ncbi:helix-turn-helix transcriptional regulator [Sphaerisporangium sp. TRM90804]|uniref:helix-turn-helix transcriptional regulator n=1 Tax=Sphaerisporangium sp. TRM90804 TaxID=3031113 RepID=UPI00244A898A|nr:helix-turn-helix transcriptional regulator [Sphaerisporangium sp. TRM90804]MDH2425517.1 helix-turn-helix transcriptional regulator [Sphaerisporangium sp. TRM90804]